MNEGDIVLTPMPQADGRIKYRPAIILKEMPGSFRDVLVCGVSTQIHLCISGFDEIIAPVDDDFSTSGLLDKSLIRLGFLAVLPRRTFIGSIGSISPHRHERLLRRLSDYLKENL